MFGLALFRSFSVRYTLLLRESNSQVKKVNVGEVIKKLNKENKSLFGELLETRPQKLKREARNGSSLPTSAEPQSGTVKSKTSSAAWWYRQTLPSSYIIRPKENPTTSSEVEIENCVKSKKHTSEASQKTRISNSFVKCQSEASPCSTSFILESSACVSSSKSNRGIGTSHVADIFEKTEKKYPTLKLPDVIIRNIPNFPLLNENKDMTQMTPAGNILNMSSSTKHFDDRKDCLLYPSVSKILNATMSDSSRAALKRWRQKMISELGEEGFLNHYRDILDRGSQFHAAIQNRLSGAPESDLKLDQILGCWQSMTDVITDVTDVKVLESHVVHSSLLYRGVIDCVAHYKGKPVLIEWKKSDKQKLEIEKTYDAPLQLCAYFGAMNYDVKYNFQVQGALVVVAYSDGSPANTFTMSMTDCKKYWNLWLLRLQQYWQQQLQK